MAIKINDITITGDIYYNNVRVQKVYINDELAWEGLPGNNITLTVYRRAAAAPGFRVVLTAEYPVESDITVNVRYNTNGASTTVTIYKNDRYGITGWIENYADMALITGVSPQSDSTYRYTYTSSGIIKIDTPVINSLITAKAIRFWSSSDSIPEYYTLTVESQYYVEDWAVTAYLNLGSTLTSVGVTLRNTKKKTISETGKKATKCEWVKITQPTSSTIGYYYIQGPTTYKSIREY